VPVPPGVAVPGARLGTRVSFGADMLRHFEFHQRLAEHAHSLTEEIDIVLHRRLA
jgi:hypothetical protein